MQHANSWLLHVESHSLSSDQTQGLCFGGAESQLLDQESPSCSLNKGQHHSKCCAYTGLGKRSFGFSVPSHRKIRIFWPTQFYSVHLHICSSSQARWDPPPPCFTDEKIQARSPASPDTGLLSNLQPTSPGTLPVRIQGTSLQRAHTWETPPTRAGRHLQVLPKGQKSHCSPHRKLCTLRPSKHL